MRILSPILLLATACGQNVTQLEDTCAADETFSASVVLEQIPYTGESTASEHRGTVPADPTAESTPPTREGERSLCLSPSDELLEPVRAAVHRFTDRLEIPVVIGEGCIPVTVQDGVFHKGKAYSALARYSRRCVFDDCNNVVSIAIDRSMLTTKSYNLAPVLDHEIGHVLSAWGHVSKVNMHVQEEYHVMSAGVLRGVEWTQEDIDLWCSASPCGRTELRAEWTYPVLPPQVAISDGGTSILSDGLRADGGVSGLSPDAGLGD